MEAVFRAIADPTRREMLGRLAAGPLVVAQLGQGFPISQPAVSQHLKVLRDAGLVRSERQGRQRLYHLEPQGLQQVASWVQRFESFWEARLDGLEAVLDALGPYGTDEPGEVDDA